MKTPIKQFESFLKEAADKKKPPIRLLIVSSDANGKNPYITAGRLQDECEKQGIKSFIANIEEALIVLDPDTNITTISNSSDNENWVLDKNTVAVIRGSAASKDSYMDLISQLEKIGIPCVNNRETINICADKYWTSIKLRDANVTQPRTALVRSQKMLKDSMESIDLDYPFILKTLRGSKGVGVMFIESERSLDALISMLYKLDEKVELIVQQFIESDGDVRVQILGDEIIGAMKRMQIKKDFRSNYSQGAEVKNYKLSDEEKELCMKAHKAVNGAWSAVDFIHDKDGNPYILEVNSSPGTEGFEDATDINIAKTVVEFLEDRVNWRRTPQQIGKFEQIYIKGVGRIVANFDTGNSAKCSLHAEKFEVKGRKVHWEENGHKFTHDLVKMITFERGAVNASSFERPMIHLEVSFNGADYEEVEFILDDREQKTTKCLMNQRFMKRSNVMVNPARNFVVTDFIDSFELHDLEK
jgi:ribosomal protein S6--L-glutamate ligase